MIFTAFPAIKNTIIKPLPASDTRFHQSKEAPGRFPGTSPSRFPPDIGKGALQTGDRQ